MPSLAFEMRTSLEPDRVVSLLTDFSERRPERWPGLWAGAYEVFWVEGTSAEVQEGNKRPWIRAREHYDWSTPGTVRWEVVQSNIHKPGGFMEVRAEPGESGGSRLHVRWRRNGVNLKSRLLTAMIFLSRGAPLKSQLRAGFAKAEAAT